MQASLKQRQVRDRFRFLTVIAAVLMATAAFAADPLPSWNDSRAQQGIVQFVDSVTREGSPDFVPVEERIAVFDNDGTLWSEQPLYFQALFAFDRVQQLAGQHPEWKTREPFASVLRGDMQGALAGGEHALLELVMATHTGMTTEEFDQIVNGWIATATHPTTGKLYTDMVYQPMLELLSYLRANGFKPTSSLAGASNSCARGWRLSGTPTRSGNGPTTGIRPSGALTRRWMRRVSATGLSSTCRGTGSGFIR